MSRYIYSRGELGLVERRFSDARHARRQEESPFLLLGMAFAGLCIAASGLRYLIKG